MLTEDKIQSHQGNVLTFISQCWN